MKRLIRIAPFLLIILVFVVSGVYATWNYSELPINGIESTTAVGMKEYNHPIYITSIEWVDGNTSGVSRSSFSGPHATSSISLLANKNSYVTAKITVKNRTNKVYGYSKTYALSGGDTYDNKNITFTLYKDASCKTLMLRRELLYPETQREGANGLTFYVKFTYVSGYNPSGRQELNSDLCYEFLTPVDSIAEEVAPEETINGVIEQFDEILNATDKFDALIKAIQDPDWDISRGDDYIGTVVGSGSSDTQFLEDLFEGNLNMVINGKSEDVTVMIKYDDVTGDGNPDMTIYATTDKLSSMLGRVPVYAHVFTQVTADGITTWEPIGETFAGYANVNAYNWPHIGSGSFNTDSWSTNSSSSLRGDSIEDLV